MTSKSRAVICLLRNDLRYHDNEVLSWAHKNAEFVVPLYCFDPRHFKCTWHFGFPKTGPFRAKFLVESVKDLREQLKARKSNLVVRLGRPEEVVPALISSVNSENIKVEAIAFQSEPTKEELDVENAIRSGCGVPVHKIWGSTLYNIEDLPFQINRTPDVYTEFRKRVESQSGVRSTIQMPETFKPLPADISEGVVPSLEDLGIKEPSDEPNSAFPFKGGESTGLQRLNHYLWDTDLVSKYKETRNGLIGHEYSTKFSTWLALGCLSPRKIYEEIKKYEKERTSNQSTYWVTFELLWRDYFKFVACKFGDRLFYLSGLRGKKQEWHKDDKLFQAWKDGCTGVPFVDANMREMAATGFMSNRGRQNVASFLTKDLKLDWRLGAEWFEYLLVDHDVTSNYGNWLYSAGVGNDPRQDRKFNMIKQGLDYDPKGDYIRQWVPELSGITGGDVHTPWRLSPTALSRASVSLGETYPMPVVMAPEWNRHTSAKTKTGPKGRPQEKVAKRGIDFYFSSNSCAGKR